MRGIKPKINSFLLFSQIQQLETQVIDAEKRAFSAHQQVRIQTKVCILCPVLCAMCLIQHVLVKPGAVDGGEAESTRQSVGRLGGAFVSAMPGAAGLGAGEGGRHRPAGAAAGGAGKTHAYEEFHQSNRCSPDRCFFSAFSKLQKNAEEDVEFTETSQA